MRLCAGERVACKPLLEALPARAFFDGVKTRILAAIEDGAQLSLAEMPWLKIAHPDEAMRALCGARGIPSYWVGLARRRGAWILTAPAPLRVMTWHRSKGREADIVALDATRTGGAFVTGAVDDAELRAMYVAITRARDRLIVFARGEIYAELEAAVAAAQMDAVPF
jgi:hypothetical protein